MRSACASRKSGSSGTRRTCWGWTPAECVFIDDIEVNVTAAEAIGMTAILHHDPAVTLARLGELLGLALTG